MDPVYQDELILGFQSMSDSKWSWSVRGIYRDLHNAIDDVAKPFVDQGHYSDAASRRLAERLAGALGPELGR